MGSVSLTKKKNNNNNNNNNKELLITCYVCKHLESSIFTFKVFLELQGENFRLTLHVKAVLDIVT